MLQVRITEPVTMLTDYLLAVLCGYWALSLLRRQNGTGVWVAAFSATALAALLGGTAHGFRLELGARWELVWTATVVAIASGASLLVAAGVRSAAFPGKVSAERLQQGRRWLRRAVALTALALGLLFARVSLHPQFNHNDLYHVIQGLGLFVLYRSATLLHGPGLRRHPPLA